jgi:hypothetical protein
MKKCSKCNIEKSHDEFGKDKARKGGLKSWCKPCYKAYLHVVANAWHKRNPKPKHATIWARENPERYKKLLRDHYLRTPEKYKARSKLLYAIKKGLIVRPSNCSKCDSTTKIEAHHTDYSKPFDVLWLCRVCHVSAHHPVR